jgi:hypothetical protein
MRDEIGAHRGSEAAGDNLDELREETREVGSLRQHEIPFQRNRRNSTNRFRRIEGASCEKM